MPAICECTIKLVNNSNGKYLPGQPLVGFVELCVREAFKITGVSIQVKGYAIASWYKRSGLTTVHYHGNHRYIDTIAYLEGSADGNKYEIAAGTHSYQFACVLPDNLAASFEGVHGHIRYEAFVVVHRPWRLNPMDITGFEILPQLDLNESATALNVPCKMEMQKVFCCGPWATDPLHISAQIPVTGYVSGETIALRIQSTNQSNREIDHFYAKLIQNESYICEKLNPRKELIRRTVIEASCKGVSPGEKVTRDILLAIPDVLPSSNKLRLITIWYELDVVCQMPDFIFNPQIRMPIVIGTIPFVSCPLPTLNKADNGLHVNS